MDQAICLGLRRTSLRSIPLRGSTAQPPVVFFGGWKREKKQKSESVEKTPHIRF